MFRNYIKTALRNLSKNRKYALVNILGLSGGIAISLVIFLIIEFHLSFDNFHAKKDRIYRVLTEFHHSDAASIFYGKGVPFVFPPVLKAHFPEIQQVASFYTQGDDQILVLDKEGHAEKKFKESTGVFVTEPSFFQIFDFAWLAGNPQTALQLPGSAVLSKETAEKYFGDWKQAMGRTIRWNNLDDAKVTGILQAIPSNTDFPMRVVLSMGTGYTSGFATRTNWNNLNGNFGCYILLPPTTNASHFNDQLRAFSKQVQPADDKDSRVIQPLSEIHFDTHSGNWSGQSISPEMIRALWIIAGFILLIACVNFVNLSTAQAVTRAKEVGVRKVLGSNRKQLRIQFLMETAIIVSASLVLALPVSVIVLPSIGRIMNLALTASLFSNPIVYVYLAGLWIAVILLAGFYPSTVLSKFNPIQALKSKLSNQGSGGVSLRKGLVVLQFVIAQALIIGTLVITYQMHYFVSRPLGFDKEAIVNVPFPGDSAGISKLDYLRREMVSISGVRNVSFSSNTPIEDDNDSWTKFNFNGAMKETDFWAILKFADYQYLPTYGLHLVAGRNLEASDTVREYLVDESLVQNLGLKNPEQAINKEIELGGQFKGHIVGVIKEFNARSFRRDLAPVLITTFKLGYSVAGIKLSTQEMTPTLRSIARLWDHIYPDFVFEYQFLDSKIANFYTQERQLSDLYNLFAAIAIFLSCLGLYGLTSFMAVQRLREVGIRKVLGARPSQVVYLFSKEFMLLVGIAFLIACPLAWYFMQKWLQDYPYRIALSWWLFAAGGLASLVVAFLSMSFQALKTASTNPAKTLRTE